MLNIKVQRLKCYRNKKIKNGILYFTLLQQEFTAC